MNRRISRKPAGEPMSRSFSPRASVRMLLALLCLAAAAPLAAQDAPRAPLTAEAARRAADFYNAPGTLRLSGRSTIPAAASIRGDVAVLDGSLVVAGRIDGNVLVLNGDLELAAGGAITGTATVVGGAVRGAAPGTVGGDVAVYAERLEYARRGDRIEPGERLARADRSGAGWSEADTTGRRVRVTEPDDDEAAGWTVRRATSRNGRAEFIVATGQSYNRVEGLPVTFGPLIETAGRNPLRLRAMGIFRTENGPALGPGRWGYDGRLEQFIGGRGEFRVGVSAFRRIDPVEEWHLSKLENGLATFLLHRDYRDHYERRGVSAFATVSPRESPFEATLELRSERQLSVPAGSPFTLFDNSEPWRPQPLAAHGILRALALSAKVDTRSTALDPASGWFLRAEVEQGLGSSLQQPHYVTYYDPASSAPPVVTPGTVFGPYTSGMLDVRRYNRIGPWSRLNLRLALGGSMDGSPLPPQRQHALGGEGSLPAFGLFALDCGARDAAVYRVRDIEAPRPAGEPLPRYFRAYGCDRFALGQMEYRGVLKLRIRWDSDGDERPDTAAAPAREPWTRTALRRATETEFGWVLFTDAGRGWTLDPTLRDTRAAVDVGAGIIVGRLGVYGAVPVTAGGGFNLFVRLNPRI